MEKKKGAGTKTITRVRFFSVLGSSQHGFYWEKSDTLQHTKAQEFQTFSDLFGKAWRDLEAETCEN